MTDWSENIKDVYYSIKNLSGRNDLQISNNSLLVVKDAINAVADDVHHVLHSVLKSSDKKTVSKDAVMSAVKLNMSRTPELLNPGIKFMSIKLSEFANSAPGTKKDHSSMSERAKLVFNAGRVDTTLREMYHFDRVSPSGAVAFAAFLEYLTVEILKGAMEQTIKHKAKRIANRYVLLAIADDSDLRSIIDMDAIPMAGAKVHTHNVLLSKAQRKRALEEAA